MANLAKLHSYDDTFMVFHRGGEEHAQQGLSNRLQAMIKHAKDGKGLVGADSPPVAGG